MGVCKNCRFWGHESESTTNPDFCGCFAPKADTMFYPCCEPGEIWGPALIETAPNFGCVLFEPKE